jgi:hypothetical protein
MRDITEKNSNENDEARAPKKTYFEPAIAEEEVFETFTAGCTATTTRACGGGVGTS